MSRHTSEDLRAIRNHINASKRTLSYYPSSHTTVNNSNNSARDQDVEMGDLRSFPSRAQVAHTRSTPPIDSAPDAAQPVFPQELLPRPCVCTCLPLTIETPIQLCKCKCHHASSIGSYRFSRILLHSTIKPLLYLALSSALLTFLMLVPIFLLWPTTSNNSAIMFAFIAIFTILWVLCNFTFLGMALIKRGFWVRKGLKLAITANALLIVWFTVTVTVAALTAPTRL